MSDDKLKEIIDIYHMLGIDNVNDLKSTFNAVELDGRNLYKTEEIDNSTLYTASAKK